MIKFTSYSVSISLSLGGHLFAIALLTYYLHMNMHNERTFACQDKVKVASRNIVLKTYIENPVINSPAISRPTLNQLAIQATVKKLTPQTKKIHGDKIRTTPIAIRKNNHHKIERILQMLIAEQQFYPEKAYERNQTGTVTIQFRLRADGYVVDMKILKSSGFSLLDAAAMQIVQNISPAKAALPFLKSDDSFEMNIIF